MDLDSLKEQKSVILLTPDDLILKTASTNYYRISLLKRNDDIFFHIDFLVKAEPKIWLNNVNRIIHVTHNLIPPDYRKVIDRLPHPLLNSICLSIYGLGRFYAWKIICDMIFDALLKEFATYDNPKVPQYVKPALNIEKFERTERLLGVDSKKS